MTTKLEQLLEKLRDTADAESFRYDLLNECISDLEAIINETKP